MKTYRKCLLMLSLIVAVPPSALQLVRWVGCQHFFFFVVEETLDVRQEQQQLRWWSKRKNG